ncbi:hypothetical protein DPMN_188332, partial [Dreissena polymorpha]
MALQRLTRIPTPHEEIVARTDGRMEDGDNHNIPTFSPKSDKQPNFQKMPTSLSETLPGQVRISSLNCASGKFKTGALYLECNEHGHHQMKVIYNCGPARTFTVTAANLIKKCIKEQMCYIELDGKDYTTISFKPDVACRQKCNSKLTAFCDNVLKSASKANFNSKAEVGVTMVPDTGPKSGLFASFGSNNTLNSPKTSPSFT